MAAGACEAGGHRHRQLPGRRLLLSAKRFLLCRRDGSPLRGLVVPPRHHPALEQPPYDPLLCHPRCKSCNGTPCLAGPGEQRTAADTGEISTRRVDIGVDVARTRHLDRIRPRVPAAGAAAREWPRELTELYALC